MNRRNFLKILPTALVPPLIGCAYRRIDPWHVLIRSDVIQSLEDEARVLKRAKLTTTTDGTIKVLFVQGTPYERGYQHGKLLRSEVNDNLGYLHRKAKDVLHFDELFAEAYERMAPFIPAEYIEEMHGLAHGARMPLSVIHHIHVLPCIGEWGGRKRIKGVIKEMMSGELGTSCSNVAAFGSTTVDGKLYAIRVLDWGMHRISRLHKYPLITVGRGESGNTYANIGWVGFLGAVSGMNDQGITLGEMGYRDPPNETLRGKPMTFLLRDILSYASNLADVRRIIQTSPGTNSFAYLMTDGKSRESELYIRDRDRFLVFQPSRDIRDKEDYYPAIEDLLYGGHYDEKMTALLNESRGRIGPELFMEKIIPEIAMPSNFQNVVYSPTDLRFWVNNAKSKKARAAEQPYTYFDLKEALSQFPA